MLLITGNPPAAYIHGKKIKLIDYSENLESEVECNLSDLKGLKAFEFPDLLIANLNIDQALLIPKANRYYIYRADESYTFSISFGEEEGVWGEKLSTKAIHREIAELLTINDYGEKISSEYADGDIFIYADVVSSNEDLFNLISEKLQLARDLVVQAESRLLGFYWKQEFEVVESIFTKELVIPLVQKMGFQHVRYNHGTTEFGRDILFSELDRFGNSRRYAAQVKAGDIRGGANSLIDAIIAQIDDAFSMPVQGPGQAKNYHISELFIITSGKISENAVKKINEKIDRKLSGSVFFIDRDDIEWLAKKYWPL